MAASEGPLCVVTYVYGLEECLLVLGRKKGREVGREMVREQKGRIG